jgi:hypothetical protein
MLSLRPSAAVLTVALIMGACAASNGGKGQTSKDTRAKAGAERKTKTMDITPYKSADEAFWTTTDRGSDKIASDLVGDYQGLLVDAPAKVPIDQRQTLPAGIYHLGSIREVSTVPFKRFGVFTAMNATENQLHVAGGRSFDQDDDIIEAPQPADASKYPAGDMSATESVELRSVMQLPWEPSRYLLTAVIRDKVSNRAAVELCQSASCFVDPEVVKYREAERAKVNPKAVEPQPGSPLPSYRSLAESPAIPEQPGIQFTTTRVVDQRRDEPWAIHGAFRLKALPHELVKAGWSDPYYSQRPANTRPAAVITVWLMMTGANDGSVFVFPLRVPAWTRAGEAFTGYFAFDLKQMQGAPTDAQTYFLYAFSGENMGGPIAAGVVK